jgi:hypothetical protein
MHHYATRRCTECNTPIAAASTSSTCGSCSPRPARSTARLALPLPQSQKRKQEQKPKKKPKPKPKQEQEQKQKQTAKPRKKRKPEEDPERESGSNPAKKPKPVKRTVTNSSKQRPLPATPDEQYRIRKDQIQAADIIITYEHTYLKELDTKINTSGLRYGPCMVPKEEMAAPNEAIMRALYERRIGCLADLTVTVHRDPKPARSDRKLCVAVSVGCPSTLTTKKYLEQLHWYRKATDRPTYLLVHQCELGAYQKHVEPLLKSGKVGLASWNCGVAAGFGLTRRAAQLLSHWKRPTYELVMCDSNVAANDALSNNYETDSEEEERRGDPHSAHLCSPGVGEAKPTAVWGKAPRKKKLPGNGRPIEQVTVGSVKKFLFDPAFITSNEDMAVTWLHHPDDTTWSSHKKNEGIRKFPHADKSVANAGDLTHAYSDLRNHYLNTILGQEDAVSIIYRCRANGEQKPTPLRLYRMTLGQLTAYLHTIHPSRSPTIVRSTIIEIILVTWMRNGWKSGNRLTASEADWGNAVTTDNTASLGGAARPGRSASQDEFDERFDYGDDGSSSSESSDDEEFGMSAQRREMRDHGYGYSENEDEDEEKSEGEYDDESVNEDEKIDEAHYMDEDDIGEDEGYGEGQASDEDEGFRRHGAPPGRGW